MANRTILRGGRHGLGRLIVQPRFIRQPLPGPDSHAPDSVTSETVVDSPALAGGVRRMQPTITMTITSKARAGLHCAVAASIGIIAWHGKPELIALSAVIPTAIFLQRSRREAFWLG